MFKNLNRILMLAFSPVVVVFLSTFFPFVVPYVDEFDQQTSGLIKIVGFDSSVLVYATSCYIAFFISFYFISVRNHKSQIAVKPNLISMDGWARVYRIATCVSLAVGGLGVLSIIYTLGITNAQEIISLVIQQSSVEEYIYGDASYRYSSTVPGFIRMLGYWIISAYLSWLAVFMSQPRWFKAQRGYLVLFLLGGMVVFYFLVVQSRAPLVGAILTTVFTMMYRYQNSSGKIIASMGRGFVTVLSLMLGAGLTVAGILLTRASRGHQLNPFFDYADIGIANAILSMQTATSWTYGFSTLLSPLSFVLKMCDADFVPTSNAEWISTPAASLLAYSYQDFGHFGFIVYAVLGLAMGFVWRRRSALPSSTYWCAIQLWMLMGISTIWTVPLFRGPDYWAALFGILIIQYFIARAEKDAFSSIAH